MVLHVFISFLGGVPLCIPYGLYSGTSLGGTTRGILGEFPGQVLSTDVGIVIILPRGIKTTLTFNLTFECTNSQVEYEALVIDLEILLELGAKDVRVIGDSQLVLRKLTGKYKCNNLLLTPYFTTVIQLLDSFDNVEFEHMLRESN